jgi:pilus assembly protein Flp/PilA
MKFLMNVVSRFRRDEKGASLVEYGLLVGLIAVVCIAAVSLLGSTMSGYFGQVQQAVSTP